MVAGGVQRFQVAPADSGQIGEEQARLAVFVAGDHDGDIGDATVRHGPFRSGQTAAHDAGVNGGGFGIAVAFRERQTADQRPIRQLRQPLPPLRVRSGCQDRLGGQVGGGTERHRGDRAAHLLGQHAQAFVAQAGAAEFFRDRGTDPAHLGDRAPQVGGIGLLSVQGAPDDGRRASLRQEAAWPGRGAV